MLRQMLQRNCSMIASLGARMKLRAGEIALPFQGLKGQIGDAFEGTDHFCVFVGPGSQRDCDGAGIGPAGRRRSGWARWQGAYPKDGDPGVVA
jgi:hypothetical protein